MTRVGVVLLTMTSVLVSCAAVEEEHEDGPSTGGVGDDLQLRFGTGRLAGSFSKDTTTISFEARRGTERSPKDLEHDPAAQRFSVAARFLDETGRTFLVQHDDDQDGWSLEVPTDPALRRAAIAAALEAADAIRVAEFPETHRIEQRALADLAATLRRVPATKALRAPPSPAPNRFTPEPGDRISYYCPGDNGIEWYIAKKDAFFDGFPGEHTAALYAGYGPSIVQEGQDPVTGDIYPCTYPLSGIELSCNHGSCASSPDMILSCGGGAIGLSSPVRAFPTSGSGGGACRGGCYGVTSLGQACYGLALGYHVCNDDTRVQINNILNDRIAVPENWCTPFVPHFYGPGCWGEEEVIPPGAIYSSRLQYATMNAYNTAILMAATAHFVWY